MKQCKKCHHAQFHHGDVETSFEYYTDGEHANWDKLTASTTVTRVETGHNCWSGDCAVDGETILAGIEAWVAEMEAEGWERPKKEYNFQTGTVGFVDHPAHVLEVDGNQYLGSMVAAGTGTNTWATPIADDPDGAITSYVMAPAGGNPRNANDAGCWCSYI